MLKSLKYSLIFIVWTNISLGQTWQPSTGGLLSNQPTSNIDIKFRPNLLNKDWICGWWLDEDSLRRAAAYREGGEWVSLPFSLSHNGYTADIVQYGDTLVMGGVFEDIILDKDSSTIPPGFILKYFNDSVWTTDEIFYAIYDLEVSGDSLIVAASVYVSPDTSKIIGPHVLTTDGGVTWNWPYPYPDPANLKGLGGPWDKVQIRKNNLFAIRTSTSDKEGIVRWDGQQWYQYGQGIYGFASQIYDYEFYNDELYIGGSFTKAEDSRNPGERIAKWTGSNWETVGGGSLYPVWSFFKHDSILYCHIRDSGFGDANIPYLAGWDGRQWCGTPVNYSGAPPITFGFINDTLFSFWKSLPSTANGDPLSSINYFDGDYVNGPNAICSTLGIGQEELPLQEQIKLFPNPASSQIQVSLKDDEIYDIEVYNLNGQKVMSKSYEDLSAVELNILDLVQGVYFIRVNGEYNDRFIKE